MKEKKVSSNLPCIGCYGEEDEMCSDCDDSKKCKREKEIIMAKITGTKVATKTKLEFDTELIEDPETRMDALSDMSPALLKKVAEHYGIELSGKSKNQMLLDIDSDFESKENVGKEDSEEEVEEEEEETGFDAEELADLIAKATKGNKAKILGVINEYLESFEEAEDTENTDSDEEDDDDDQPKIDDKKKTSAKKPVIEEDEDDEEEDDSDDNEEEEDSDDDDSDSDDDEEEEEKPKLTISANLLKAISVAGLKQKLSKDSMIIMDAKNKTLATIKSDGKVTYLIPTTVPKGVKLVGKFAGKPAIDVKDKGIITLISKMS